MEQFGTLNKLRLRDIWEHEARDFTPWLAGNLNVLGKALSMDLELEGQEVPIGGYSLDLLANDLDSGDKVVIENQIEPSDHIHLGQLLTYASWFDRPTTAIWIAESFRKEHRKALENLNQRTDLEILFFAVVVEAIQIDDSRVACNFKPIVIPTKWPKAKKRQTTKSILVNGKLYKKFFQALIDDLRENHQFTNTEDVRETNTWEFLSGAKGFRFCAAFYQHEDGRPCIEAYIDMDKENNKELFDVLYAQQKTIETNIGSRLVWERQDDKSTSRIRLYRDGSIESSKEKLEEIHTWMVENLLEFKRVFFPMVSNWQKENLPQNSEGLSIKNEKYLNFFQVLVDDLRENHRVIKVRVAQPSNWQAFFIFGSSGVNLDIRFAHNGRVRSSVYIDQGNTETTKAVFNALHNQRESIEAELDAKLDWSCSDDKRNHAFIALYRNGSIESPKEDLKEIHDWMIKNLLAFKQVFSPRIKAILG